MRSHAFQCYLETAPMRFAICGGELTRTYMAAPGNAYRRGRGGRAVVSNLPSRGLRCSEVFMLSTLAANPTRWKRGARILSPRNGGDSTAFQAFRD